MSKVVSPRGWPDTIRYLPDYEFHCNTSDEVILTMSAVPSGQNTANFGYAHPAYPHYGLFAAKNIPPETHILNYVGIIYSNESFPQDSDYVLTLDQRACIDAAIAGNEARFINDYRGIGDRPNVAFGEFVDKAGVKRMGISTVKGKGLRKGDELLLNYGKGFWQESKWARSEDSSGSDGERSRKKAKREKQRASRPADSSTPTAESTVAAGITADRRPASHDPAQQSPTDSGGSSAADSRPLYPLLASCRSVENYEKLNRIDEGAYGVVYRAKDRTTGEFVALKKLKLENEKAGFPVTSLREIHTLLLCKHRNIVNVREIVVGESLTSVFIVMDFIEHDLKTLLTSMTNSFLLSEVKLLLRQLLSAIALLHENWVVHRDLKTSNLLMNNRGEIKVADFGLARKFGEPLGNMTQVVVTLWYRAPELLLGAKDYSTAVDMWSIGCIFGELINKEPLLPGRGELDQLDKTFKLLGQPTEKSWPGLAKLPHAKTISFNYPTTSSLRSRFPTLTQLGLDLMARLLAYDPDQRICAEDALQHPFFREHPLPKDSALFPTFPSKAEGQRKKKLSPSAPVAFHGLGALEQADGDGVEGVASELLGGEASVSAFRLRF